MIPKQFHWISFPTLFVLTLILCTASRCDEDEPSGQEVLTNSLSQGTWRVFYFFDQTDETSDFNGYTFIFASSGVLTAQRGALTTEGTWSIENSSNGDTKLNMDLGTVAPLDELTEDWRMVVQNDTKIELENVSGGNGDTKHLILEILL